MPLDEFLLKQVVSLYKKKEYNYKIKKFLVSKNIEEEEIKQYMDQGREMAKSKQIKVFRLFWLLGAVGLLFSFLFLIPLAKYNDMPLIFTIFGSLFFALFLTLYIFNFKSTNEILNNIQNEDASALKAGGLFFVLAFGILYGNYYLRFQGELKENGVITNGEVVEKYFKQNRRGTKYYLKIKFETKKGEIHYLNHSVSQSNYTNIRINQEIKIKYSENDPTIVEVLMAKSNIADQNKNKQFIQVTHLEMLLKLKNKFQMQLLRKINPNWEFQQKDTSYLNSSTKEKLKIYETEYLDYTIEGKLRFNKGPEELNFRISEYGYYETDYLILTVTENRDDSLNVINNVRLINKMFRSK